MGSLNFDRSLLDIVQTNDIDLNGTKWTDTNNTNFVLDYFNHSRSLTLKSRSPDLEFEDIPNEYLNNPPDAIVLAPLCNEISFDYIGKILENFPDAYIGIDLQGFIRKIENGHVSIEGDEKIIANMEKIIYLIGERLILKGSEEEMKILSGENDIYKAMNHFDYFDFKGIFIMTLGEVGSLILKKGEKILNIPAFQSSGVIDETGAGDVYFAVFLYEYIISDKTWNSIEKAAWFASSSASFNVEAMGPNGFQHKTHVQSRIDKKNISNRVGNSYTY